MIGFSSPVHLMTTTYPEENRSGCRNFEKPQIKELSFLIQSTVLYSLIFVSLQSKTLRKYLNSSDLLDPKIVMQRPVYSESIRNCKTLGFWENKMDLGRWRRQNLKVSLRSLEP